MRASHKMDNAVSIQSIAFLLHPLFTHCWIDPANRDA
jgi:hypothetical protein